MKTFGAPVIAGNIGGNNPIVKDLVVRGTTTLGAEIGTVAGISADSATGFTYLGFILLV